MNTNEQAVELARLEQQAVELCKEYSREYQAYLTAPPRSAYQNEAYLRMHEVEKRIDAVGRKLLEADNV